MPTLTSLIAFVAALPALKAETAPTVPDFSKPTWHSRGRLDIRPVLWSLRNRPEEWASDIKEMGREYTVTHKPSKHTFWTASGFWFYRLGSTDCSCQQVAGGNFSFIQKCQFGSALKAWRKAARQDQASYVANINEHFREHFIP